MQKESQRLEDAAANGRPVIIISGGNDRFGLPERIVNEARSKYHAEVEVGSGRLQVGFTLGDRWADPSVALQRSRVVVVLLSKGYLESSAAERDLLEIDSQSRRSGQEILLVLLGQCDWQRIDVLKQRQVWNPKAPLNELSSDQVEKELGRLVEQILELAGLQLPSAQDPTPLRFALSQGAAAAMMRAQDLAKRSNRNVANCSCLLFALSEGEPSNTQGTERFVRETLDAKGHYATVFQRFLVDTRHQVTGKVVEGLTGRFSANAVMALISAETIASRVGRGTKEIHRRHLFGALISGQRANSAKQRIKQCEIELPQIVEEFLAFLEPAAPQDNLQEWREILGLPRTSSLTAETDRLELGGRAAKPTPSSYTSGAPGYNSEFCGVGRADRVSDYLGVEVLADRLAELISLKETRLPLAIGLFGNWGCGKSHFMNLIDRRIKSLALEARSTIQSQVLEAVPESRWCREIVPIYFNAWHYSDSNLWASLVTEVFESLFAHLQPKGDELALLEGRLRMAGGVTSLAEEQVKTAKENVVKAARVLDSAIVSKNSARHALQGLLEGLKNLTPELVTTEDRKRAAELLGVSPEDATLSDLQARYKELTSIAGRSKELWRRATDKNGLAVRLGWLVGVAVVIILVDAARHYVSHVDALLRWMGPWIRGALIGLAGIGAWITPAIRQVQAALAQLEALQKRAEHAQEVLQADPRVARAQNVKSEAEAMALDAEQALAAAQAEELSLRLAIDSLRPERRLGRFIETRVRSADYRGQLGLVSLARRDFSELSRIFTDAESIKREIKDKPQQVEGLERLSLKVDRVVLFIDDLDRCDPEKIVDVLQAVHLLLAYPLFAVVVGVDQRVLRQSLRMRFRGVGQDHDELRTSDVALGETEEAPATPLDYLEKIFHIPFHLPRMDKAGFETLVWNLTQPAAPSIGPEGTLSEDASIPATNAGAAVDMDDGPNLDPAEDEEADESAGDDEAGLRPLVGSVPLNDWERNALKDYYLLIPTPRGATRFLNTYRLVRAGVAAAGWDRFRGDEGGLREFRLPMLLLAVAAGQPAVAREWFRLAQQHMGGPLPALENLSERNAAAWEEFRRFHEALEKQMHVPLTRDLLTNWISRVERFTF
jgi:KAP family P-loop domain